VAGFFMAKKSPKEVLQQSQEPLLVDFYADWCGPCQTLAPVLDQVVAELAGKVILFKVNIDKHPQLAQQFAIRSIPHLMLFKKGKILWRKGGLLTSAELLKQLKGFVQKKGRMPLFLNVVFQADDLLFS
jgi:thioredoxin 1